MTSITVSDNQPASGEAVYLYVYFDGAPGFTPQWQFQTQEGSTYSGAMTMMSDNYYTATIDGWTGTAMEIEILDNGNAFIPNGHYDFTGSGGVSVTSITVSDNQPDNHFGSTYTDECFEKDVFERYAGNIEMANPGFGKDV